ncbi:3-oxoadipate enol-lactone hydrolase [Novosphingobium sp. PC22D]|uniref:alpha/beta fold hydrolase n=1 Tax=Novosphingobium sp. PC22D TaxID=1962403 RepID=UPI000BEFBBB8|nr:alpha/beta fold hydrolase [Novosphingobium sp. PC22D]PEQ11508.1 3-oxoadipate enol-lactone hydrolase [Novosphingobium sp. PC22D]
MSEPFSVAAEGTTLVGDWRKGARNVCPLVLAHGFGGSRRDWGAVVDALPADHSVLRYDQRGFGDSPYAETPYSHADDLLALFDELDIARADLCGMSLGGSTVLHFALDHPERVHRLILVSPLIVGWSWSEEWIALWKAIGRLARADDMDGARQAWLAHPLFDQVRGTDNEQYQREAIAAFHGRQWIADAARPEVSDVERLHKLEPPTLLLTGERDMADFRLIADLIAGAAPEVTRIDYREAGHMLTLERPAEIGKAIGEFVA